MQKDTTNAHTSISDNKLDHPTGEWPWTSSQDSPPVEIPMMKFTILREKKKFLILQLYCVGLEQNQQYLSDMLVCGWWESVWCSSTTSGSFYGDIVFFLLLFKLSPFSRNRRTGLCINWFMQGKVCIHYASPFCDSRKKYKESQRII